MQTGNKKIKQEKKAKELRKKRTREKNLKNLIAVRVKTSK